jgi:hypothetical protein
MEARKRLSTGNRHFFDAQVLRYDIWRMAQD